MIAVIGNRKAAREYNQGYFSFFLFLLLQALLLSGAY